MEISASKPTIPAFSYVRLRVECDDGSSSGKLIYVVDESGQRPDNSRGALKVFLYQPGGAGLLRLCPISSSDDFEDESRLFNLKQVRDDQWHTKGLLQACGGKCTIERKSNGQVYPTKSPEKPTECSTIWMYSDGRIATFYFMISNGSGQEDHFYICIEGDNIVTKKDSKDSFRKYAIWCFCDPPTS